MEWFIMGRDMHVLCNPSTDAPKSLQIYDDKQTNVISNNTVVSTYDFTISKQHKDATKVQLGGYIVFVDKYRKTKMYTLMSYDGDDITQTWHAEDIGLDLLNESSEKWIEKEPHPIAWYLENRVIGDSGWTIGINEIPQLSRTLSFDGESDTQLTRLGDIANQFDGAEIDFSIEMRGSQVTQQHVNIYKKIGSNVIQDRYVDSVNLISLHSTGTIESLTTALKPFGSEMEVPEGSPEGTEASRVTLYNVKYDDGRYYSPWGHVYLYDRQARQQWSRFNQYNSATAGEFDGYIVGSYSYDTLDENELLKHALTQLKKQNTPQETFEAQLSDINADIGDYVQIAHSEYNPPLYLKARVEQVENSYTQDGADTGVLGDYTHLQSQIDPRVKDLLNDLENKMKFNYTWIRYASDDKGSDMTSFPTADTKYIAIIPNKQSGVPSDDPKDYEGKWQLIAGIDGKDGVAGEKGADGRTSYTHFAYANDVSGTTDFSLDDPTGRAYMGVLSDFIKADSTNPDDYIWSLTKGEDGLDGVQGIPGKPGIDGKTPYTHVAYADNDEGGGFSQSPDNKAYMGWYSDFTQADSNDPSLYGWSLIKGADGKDGADGVAGKDGVGVKTTTITYAQSTNGTTPPTASWTAGVPTLIKGQYLWTRTVWVYTDSSTETGYTVSYNAKDGNSGSDGRAGKDGVGISSTVIEYIGAVSGANKPVSGWSTTIPTVPAGQYLWTRTTWKYTDGTSEQGFTNALMGRTGDKGDPGNQGIPGKPGADGRTPYTHWAYGWSADGTDRFTTVYPEENLLTGTSEKLQTVTNASGWNANLPIIYPVISTIDNDTTYTARAWLSPSSHDISIQTVWQDSSGVTHYGGGNLISAGASGYSTWTGALTAGSTIQRVTIVFSQQQSTASTVSYREIKLEKGSVATEWTPSPLDDPEEAYPKFIGTYTDYIADDSADPSKYTWAKLRGEQGQKGDTGKDGVAGKDGVGIKSTQIMYAQSTSGTAAPTTGWTAQVPTLIKGEYLWTQTTWLYTDSTGEAGYTVSYNAKDGNSGKDGIAGKDGVGIKSTTITYQAATSGTTVPTGAWVSSPPSVPGGNYLWTRTVWSYTDSTSETGYSIAKAGEKGADGAAGKDGVAGKDGLGIKSTVIAYQLSSSGTATPTGTWLATVPALVKGQYLWTKTTLTYTDNSSEPVYSVSYVAKDGNNGANGVAGKDGVGIKTTAITYATSTSGTSAPTSGWVSAPPSAAAGQFIWTRTIWTYTDNTTETGYSVGKIGEKGPKGDTGQGIPGTPGTDGRTPYLHTAWANSFDGKNGFSTDVSTNKSYMGTYVNFTEADPTDPALYNWSLIKGADGADGAPGKPGADGKTPYFHQAWADSKDGKTNFSTTDPTSRGYLGTYSDFTQADSNDPSKYFWVELVGAIEIGGRNLVSGTNQEYAMGYGIPTTSWKDGYAYLKLPTNVINGEILPSGPHTFWHTMTQGATYTQSIWFETNATVKDLSAVQITWYTSAGHDYQSARVQKLGQNSYKIVSTYTWPGKSDNNVRLFDTSDLRYAFDLSTGTYLKFGKLKLEIGNKATDWSPAPEDTQGQIDTINQGLRDTNSKIAAVPHVSAQAGAPTNPKKGDQWWVLDAQGKATGFKVWNGTAWADSKIQQSMLNVVSLNAVTITGSTINGSKFTNSFTNVEGSWTWNGVTTIEKGSMIIDAVRNDKIRQSMSIDSNGIIQNTFNANGSTMYATSLNMGSLSMSDATYNANLTPEVLASINSTFTEIKGVNGAAKPAYFGYSGHVCWLLINSMLPVSRTTMYWIPKKFCIRSAQIPIIHLNNGALAVYGNGNVENLSIDNDGVVQNGFITWVY